MTELQRKEFELLSCLISICRTLGLRYYLVCGSALGAEKYKGFIPWDDDVDVALLREDYETLLRKAPGLLPDHLFLQNYRSDPAFPAVYSKLRDSRTTFIEKSAKSLPIHHGIYIDIFPLDGYPKGRLARSVFELRKLCFIRLLGAAFEEPADRKNRMIHRTLRFFRVHRHTQRICGAYEKLLRSSSISASGLICNHTNWQGKLEYAPIRQYGDGAVAEFEGLRVRVPEQIDEYLTQKYGDWRAEPPQTEQKPHHTFTVCDPARPFTEYMQARSEGRTK